MSWLCAHQASNSENNRSAKATKLNDGLDSTWASSMLLVTDTESDQHAAKQEPVAKLFAPSQCYKFGMCVCNNWSENLGRCVVMFRTKLVAYLKERCWSKNKQKSEQRKLLEKAFVVLGLEAKEPADDSIALNIGKRIRTRIYLHIGFVNFLTWQFTVLPLYEGDLYGFEKLEDRTLRTWGLAMEPSSDDLDVCTDEFQTFIDFIKDNIDVRLSYSAQLYELESSIHEPLHPVDFKSGYVTITKIRGLDHDEEDGVVFWKGSAVELRSNKRKTVTRTRTRHEGTSRKTQKTADTTRKDDAETMLALEDYVDSDIDGDVVDDGDSVNLEDHFADIDMQDGNGSESDSNGDSNPAGGDDREGGAVSDNSDDVWNDVLDEMEQLRTAKQGNGSDSNAGSMDGDSDSSSSDSSSSSSSESSHRGGQQKTEGDHERRTRAQPATSLLQQLRSLLPEAGISGEMSISRDPNSYGYRVLYPYDGISALLRDSLCHMF